LIITDEAHTGEADTYQIIYEFYPKSKRLGLTATPERTDGRGLKNTYDIIVEPITIREAIDQGSLAEPLLMVPEQYALNVEIKDGDYDVKTQAALLGDAQIIGDVITQYGNIFAGAPCMVACCSYQHAENMTKAFNNVGWNFQHIHSNLNKHERAGLIRKIRKREINGLCTVGIGIAGLDIPGLFGLIWLRRTLSVTIYLQFIGRCIRPAKGKKYGIIIDPVGNVFIHGRPDRKRTWSLEGRAGIETDPEYAVPKMKVCPICQVMNAEENTVCHLCGFDFTDPTQRPEAKGRKIPAMVDGELVVLDGDELCKRKEEIKKALEEQRHEKEKQAKEANAPKELTRLQKVTLLKNGLEKNRSGLFADAVKKYL
jgi:superfamily II DNA or RNA helicase